MGDDSVGRTDLDSHANMFVAGSDAYVLAHSGKTADVQAFTPDIKPMAIPIVDCAFVWECTKTGRRVVLIATNALHVPTMDHSLVPPFMLREAGVEVADVPKIHAKDPDETTHSLHWPRAKVRIPLELHGIFSSFRTRRPTNAELEDEDIEIVALTPEGPWDPNSTVYADNEAGMTDWQGNVLDVKDRPQQIIIENESMIDAHVESLTVSAAEASFIDQVATTRDVIGTHDFGELPPIHCDNYRSGSSCFAASIAEQANIASFSAAFGAIEAHLDDLLFPEYDGDTLLPIGQIDLDEIMASSTTTTGIRGVSAEHLSKIWKIDLPTAKRTVEVTSQRCPRPAKENLAGNYTTNDRMLRYRRLEQHFFMDTFFATKKGGKSTRGNTCCQLFVTDKGFVYVIPMRTKSEVPAAIRAFAKAVGAPEAIVCDASGEQTSREVKQFLNRIGTALRVLEEGTPWANRAERYIGIIKAAVRKDMLDSDSPLSLWDYCVERRSRVNNMSAGSLFQLEGRNPHHHVFHEEGDISNLCQFGWYEWVYYRNRDPFPLHTELLGRCLGPSTGEGNGMSQWILKSNGKVVPRRIVRPLRKDEWSKDTEKAKRELFDSLISAKLGDSLTPMPDGNEYELNAPEAQDDFVPYGDDDNAPWAIPEVDDPVDASGHALDQQPAYDQLINAELLISDGSEYQPVRVLGRTKSPSGRVEGEYDTNPILNTMLYDVEFPDGQVVAYTANIIAENLLSQVDDEGFSLTTVACILDHRKSLSALGRDDAYTTNSQGVRRLRKTTLGWDLKVQWQDKSEQWIPLSVLKECNPVEVALYAKARGIEKEPAFAWWVPYTLRKRDVIVSAVKARARKTTHKYGIELPTNIGHAYEIDRKNGNDKWAKAVKKEMFNVGIAFKILDPPARPPPGYHKVTGHLIFDVKMSLERKARWVLDGHKTADANYSTYAGVVSRESVRIALTYAALNGLDVWAADIRNAYIQAPSSRKDFIYCGKEFGLENVGKPALIERALYGGKTAGRDFRNHLRSCMDHIGFKSCRADPDVWMRPAKMQDGSKYWEYVLLYTDDCLVISENGEAVLRNEIGKYFELKEESIGAPNIYLGGKLRKVECENGVHAWAFGSSQYIQAAVGNVENYLSERGADPLPRKAPTPLSSKYRPEVDVSQELPPSDASHYQSLIGILRWIVELGRVDICCEVSMMSSHLALPRVGHLKEVYHIFGYLRKRHNAEMVFDPTVPEIDQSQFERRDWSTSEMDMESKETLPPNMPEPRGLGFIMRALVDADHATDSMTRKSRTGFLVFLNSAPIYWMSKKQTSVETSSFGSEFIAMKLCCEYVRGLRYKLRMMGISCEEPTYIYGDNQSVLSNTTIPESTLKKKSHSIAYHFVREGVARDEWRTTYINTHDNASDLMTKCLPDGAKRHGFVRMLLRWIFDFE